MNWLTDQRLLIFILPALSLLVAVLAVAMAWTVELRSRRKLEALELLVRRLLKHKDGVSKQFSEIHAGTTAMGKRLNQLTQQVRRLEEKPQELAEQDNGNRLYSRATKLVELGADLDEIISECEIPKAEAELLLNLHRPRRSNR